MKKLLVMLLIVSMLGSMIIPIHTAAETVFDEDNIILRFGVVSDIHQDGYYASKMSDPQVQEWAHTINTFQRMAGTNTDGSTKLDALLINGDLVDGIANNGSNVGSFTQYGTKAVQNFTEASHVAQGLWGENGGGFGPGMQDGVKLFYALGNHDEDGRGYSKSYTKTIDGKETKTTPVYSADFIAAVNCGWQYNPNSEEALANTWDGAGEYDDGFESSYRDYIADLIDYNTNSATTVTADAFAAKYGVTLADADAKYDKFYGHLDKDTAVTDADGLRVGNSHMTIDPNPNNGIDTDRIHFIAIELSQSAESVAWAKEILDTSVAEDPTKPIFVITHYKMPESMFGEMAIETLHKVIKDYPQVVIWGGHSHTTMHNDTAINSDNGYVAVESATTRYLSTTNVLTQRAAFGKATSGNESYSRTAFNYPYKEDTYFGNGCYVEVDKNFNVRINRVDLYRSYSTDYENAEFYQANAYKNFTNVSQNKSFQPVDEPVFIREPWDIVDIDATGSHLAALSVEERKADTQAPTFPDGNSLSASCESGVITANIKLNAEDDGMVHMYVVELYDGETVVDRKYYTNFYYAYPQSDSTRAGDQIAELEYDATFEGLMPSTEYTVKYYAVDDFGVKSEELTQTVSTPEGILNTYELDYASAGNVNTINADTNDDTAVQWRIGHTENGNAAFFQYDLSDIGKDEEVISAEWRGFVISQTEKNLKFIQYDTETKLNSANATYNSIVKSSDYLNSATEVFSGVVNAETGYYDKAMTTNATSTEQNRFKIDMTEAVKSAVNGGNKYFTFLGMGANKYAEIYFPKYAYKPTPQLIITTRAIPQIALTNPATGNVYQEENTPFTISADVTAGSAAISQVDIAVTNSNGESVECAEPTVNNNNYTWSFANGLASGTYTAVITATDAMGYKAETTVTIRMIKYETSTIYLDPTSGGGVKVNDTSYSGGYVLSTAEKGRSYFQYDLSKLNIPEGAVIKSAKWQFVATASAKGKYIQVNSYDYQSALGDQTETYQTLTEKGYFTATETKVRPYSPAMTEEECTGNMWQNKKESTKTASAAFLNIDVTDALVKSIDGEKSYFNLMVWPASGYYVANANKYNWTPYGGSNGVLVIETYTVPAVENHILNVAEGTATASVIVNEGDAVLIIAAYNGDELVGAVVEDERDAAGNIKATLTNTDEGTTFKSFVWKDFGSMDPLSVLNQ